MRIAYVINSLEGGGAALPLVAVTQVMRDGGDEVRVLALSRRDGRAAAALDAAGLDWRVSPWGLRAHVRAGAWLLREVRRWRPDVIWTSLTQATLLGQLAGWASQVPVVSWQHNAVLKPANLAMLKATRRLTALWIADSAAVARLTRERFGLGAEAVPVWPLVVARPPRLPARPWREGEAFRIGSLGRLHLNKGYDVLVEALAQMPPAAAAKVGAFEVVVGGEGAERAALEASARARDVRTLRLPGFQADPDAFLAGCHAYVQPSRAEGLCIAAHQAMAAGLPVIVSSVGEAPVSVERSGGGWVVPPADPQALADTLSAVLASPTESAAVGARGQAWVLDRYGADDFAASGRRVMALVRALARK
ncbi:MAG: glycosyltransferase family 4 protein [Caulobacteraceae bacterium]|nr:glycosyltransferase family 4 protein [Caulobacter sp.]